TGLQFLLHAFERRDPGTREVGGVAGTKELLGSVKDILGMLVPTEARTCAKCICNPRHCSKCSKSQLEGARQVCGTVFIGKRKCLFFAEAEFSGLVIVCDISASRLR